jgi:uncharacterized membrane protein
LRNPLRTEAEAFSFVLVAAVCFLALALAAALGGTWVALAVFLALVLGIGVGFYMRSEPRTREPAVWARRPPDGRRRILVVAGEGEGDEALRSEVVRRARGKPVQILVVVPGRAGDRWSAADEEARRRAEEVVAALRAEGLETEGTVGDVDPVRALRDALRRFQADEILVSADLPKR